MTTELMRDTVVHPPSSHFDLVDAGRAVGWIAGDTIGFRGFNDETEATHAAWIAHRTLARRIARSHGMRLVPIDIEPLSLRRSDDGTTDVILASNRPIATLIRPESHPRAADSFGFELTVPSKMSEFELRGVAYLMYRTLRRSGVQWGLWRRDPRTRTEAAERRTRAAENPSHEPTPSPSRSRWTLAARPIQWVRDRLRLTTGGLGELSPSDNTTRS